jgi:hypothetical protein
MADKKYTNGKQWIVDTFYNDYQSLEQFLDENPKEDYGEYTAAHNVRQYPLWIDKTNLKESFYYQFHKNHIVHPNWDNVSNNVHQWLTDCLRNNGFDFKLIPVISWYVAYDIDSWQAIHAHSDNSVTLIIYMDDNNYLNPASKPKDAAYGSLYTIMNGERPLLNSFINFAGRSIIMSGDVFHGVYPNKSLPRRSVIFDYIISK